MLRPTTISPYPEHRWIRDTEKRVDMVQTTTTNTVGLDERSRKTGPAERSTSSLGCTLVAAPIRSIRSELQVRLWIMLPCCLVKRCTNMGNEYYRAITHCSTLPPLWCRIGCFDPFLLIPLRAPSSHDGFMVDIEWVSGWEEKGDAGNQAHTSTHRRIGDRIDYKLSNRAPVHLARDGKPFSKKVPLSTINDRELTTG